MTIPKLTFSGLAARPFEKGATQMGVKRRSYTAILALFGTAVLAGCITVNAPEEPIVIELNINITADVVYRLAEDAGSTVEDNADIF